ncbi:MAG TPA: hypothetical protein DC058_02325 [Planctomycetaceae bacterium]|nr:hypothetical protein [Planctomycetaceae bacterium]HBC60037.1 hypothetical protein [Planctomycetaceae bacterium]
MNEHMVPQFKQGQFAQGIVGGVIALDKMARGLKVPGRTRSTAEYSRLLIVAAVVIFTAVSQAAMVTVTADRSVVERSTAVRPGTMVLQGRGKSSRKLHRRAPPANDRRCRPGHSCCR